MHIRVTNDLAPFGHQVASQRSRTNAEQKHEDRHPHHPHSKSRTDDGRRGHRRHGRTQPPAHPGPNPGGGAQRTEDGGKRSSPKQGTQHGAAQQSRDQTTEANKQNKPEATRSKKEERERGEGELKERRAQRRRRTRGNLGVGEIAKHIKICKYGLARRVDLVRSFDRELQ